MSKHTPAPWKVRFFDKLDPERGFFVEAKNNNKPQLGYSIEILADDFGEHCGYPLEQRLADAKLIAAAPELLEALRSARALLSVQGITEESRIGGIQMKDINEAIKKATE